MRNLKLRLSVAVAAMLASAYLLNDALTFSLMPADPTTGRIKACYTIIEQLFGYLQPSDYIRPVQLFASAAILLLSIGYLVVLTIKWLRGKSNVVSIA